MFPVPAFALFLVSHSFSIFGTGEWGISPRMSICISDPNIGRPTLNRAPSTTMFVNRVSGFSSWGFMFPFFMHFLEACGKDGMQKF